MGPEGKSGRTDKVAETSDIEPMVQIPMKQGERLKVPGLTKARIDEEMYPTKGKTKWQPNAKGVSPREVNHQREKVQPVRENQMGDPQNISPTWV